MHVVPLHRKICYNWTCQAILAPHRGANQGHRGAILSGHRG